MEEVDVVRLHASTTPETKNLPTLNQPGIQSGRKARAARVQELVSAPKAFTVRQSDKRAGAHLPVLVSAH